MTAPFTDLVSVAIGMGVILILDMIGLVTHIGVLYVAGMTLSMFMIAEVFSVGSVVYASAYNTSTSTWSTETVDPNIIIMILLFFFIFSVVLLFYERNQR